MALPRRRTCATVAAAALAVTALAAPTSAALTASQVLVVYNSKGPDGNGNLVADSLDVYNAYAATHPGVLGFDLNDATLAPGTITYVDFEAKVRDPLRNFLNANNLASQVVALTMTKGLPHRISDTDNAGVGDSPGGTQTEFNNGDANFASVDSELTLLWQNLRTGEAGGAFDSHADNYIVNPYFSSSSPATTFARNNITAAKTFVPGVDQNNNQVGWFVKDGPGQNATSDAGDFYLVTRLDGDTVAQVVASIGRAQAITYNKAVDRVVIDENATGNLDGTDYASAATTLTLAGATVTHDTSSTFLIGNNLLATVPDTASQRLAGPVMALVTYGGNHSGASQDEYVFTWQGQLVNGAILNSMESYNGRPLGGLSEYTDQASVAEWIAAGGTFATGNVYEPFSNTVPLSNVLLDRFLLQGWTWAEAAYAAAPVLSWQQIFIGDPLATIPEPASALLLLGTPLLWARRGRRGG